MSITLLSSCSFDNMTKGDFAYSSGRLGTDTGMRQIVSQGAGGVALTITDENNSRSFQEVASVVKWGLGFAAAKSIGNNIADSYDIKTIQNGLTSRAAARASADAAAAAAAAKLQSQAISAGVTAIPAVP